DDHATVNDHALHAATGFRVDELSRGAVVRQIGNVVEVDEDQGCLVSGPDGPEAAGETGRARVAEGGMAQNFVGEAGSRLRIAHRRDKTKHLHGLKYALDVGATAVVAAEPEAHARSPHVADR